MEGGPSTGLLFVNRAGCVGRTECLVKRPDADAHPTPDADGHPTPENGSADIAVNAEAQGVGPVRAATGADLGGSSKYSREILEGRSGEGFCVISACSWVSRS